MIPDMKLEVRFPYVLEVGRGDPPSTAIDLGHTVLRAPDSDFKILEIPQRKKIDP